MTRDDDPAYFRQREKEERRRAERTDDPAIRTIHEDLAKRYAARAAGANAWDAGSALAS